MRKKLLALLFAGAAAGACGLAGCNQTHSHSFTEKVTEAEFLKKRATFTEKAEYYYSCKCGEKGTDSFEYGEVLRPTEGITYTLSSDGTYYSVTGIGTATESDIVIAPEIDGIPVTIIANDAFIDCSDLTSIIIPDGVLVIYRSVFENCSNLTSITLPDSLIAIGASAFENCSKLASITIPDGVVYLNQSVFSGCSELTSISIPDSVTGIDNWAFDNCNKLTSISIGKGVTYIAESTLLGFNNLKSITVSENNTEYASQDGILYNKAKTRIVLIPPKLSGDVTIPNGMTYIAPFYDGSELTSITIPESVTEIPDNVFRYGNGLTRITVDENNSVYKSVNNCLLSKDGKTLFLGCKNSIIPNGVTCINRYAFNDCSELTSIAIPGSVTSIDMRAFYNCRELASITFDGTMAQWKAISKGFNWNDNTGDYIVQCSNGKLDKDGNKI